MASTLFSKMLSGHRLIHHSSFLTQQPQFLSSLFSVRFIPSVWNFIWVSYFSPCFLTPLLISSFLRADILYLWKFGLFKIVSICGYQGCAFLIKVLTFECGVWDLFWSNFFVSVFCCWTVSWYALVAIWHGICFIQLQFCSVWCLSKCINRSTHHQFHNTLVWMAGCLLVPFEVNAICWGWILILFFLMNWIKRLPIFHQFECKY